MTITHEHDQYCTLRPVSKGRRMHRVTFEAHDLAGFESAARKLGETLKAPVLVLLSGDLGAGKTTFVAALLKSRGIESVTSPTFNLRNDYTTGTTRAVHIDFYRLKAADSAFDLLPPDEDYSDALVFVEWPEKAPEQLFAPFEQQVRVMIEYLKEGGRRITWQGN